MFSNILVQNLFFWHISLCFVSLIDMVVQPLSTSFGNYAFSNTNLGAVMVVFVWWLKLQPPMHSVPITTYVVNSSPDHDQVYSIQHYVIKVISDLRQVGGFLRVLRLPLPTKLIAMILLTYCWKWH